MRTCNPAARYQVVWIAVVGVFTGAVCLSPTNAQTRDASWKHEAFDRDPQWEGVNHRSALEHAPARVRQDFGYSPKTQHANGAAPGEIGGFITPSGEPAYYGKQLSTVSLDQPLSASGRFVVGRGGTHLLLGFFQSKSLNEWRTPNTLALRINGRGDKYFAYVEYCTSQWRAGGDSTPFPSKKDPATGRSTLLGFPCEESVRWTLNYDPQGANGAGLITARIGEAMAECRLDPGHRGDGATFDHFGILNVMKSVDSGSEFWLDDLQVNGGVVTTFEQDPQWSGHRNRGEFTTRLVRPWFDFGFSPTQFAGGKGRGELGGQVFRGDCREAARMASYGDRVASLTLDRPLHASGRVVMTRGVSDSTTLFGFYHSRDSMRVNESQNDAVPEAVLGIHLEGPSSEGFKIYPVFRGKGNGSTIGAVRTFPTILPNGRSHHWELDYDPRAAEGLGQIRLRFDEHERTLTLRTGDRQSPVTFDRFGIVTTWIDGNSQQVYWDDLTYTAR